MVMNRKHEHSLVKKTVCAVEYLAGEVENQGSFLINRPFRPQMHVAGSPDSLILVRQGKTNDAIFKEGLLIGSLQMPVMTALYAYSDSRDRFMCHKGAEMLPWELPACFLLDLPGYVRAARLGLTGVAPTLEQSLSTKLFKRTAS